MDEEQTIAWLKGGGVSLFVNPPDEVNRYCDLLEELGGIELDRITMIGEGMLVCLHGRQPDVLDEMLLKPRVA